MAKSYAVQPRHFTQMADSLVLTAQRILTRNEVLPEAPDRKEMVAVVFYNMYCQWSMTVRHNNLCSVRVSRQDWRYNQYCLTQLREVLGVDMHNPFPPRPLITEVLAEVYAAIQAGHLELPVEGHR